MRKNAVERAPVYTESIEIKFIRSVVCGCKFSLGKRKKEGERARAGRKSELVSADKNVCHWRYARRPKFPLSLIKLAIRKFERRFNGSQKRNAR